MEREEYAAELIGVVQRKTEDQIMEITDWQLIYDGAGTHEMRALNNAKMNARIAETTANRALAEWLLRKLDYTNRNAVCRQFQNRY